ncbi:response regulator transcription factor [Pseudanabaena sp. FACHB-2040]|uniref:response regulator transcription factor n=1 Tax=Pseudanabaena sp. FACHB-2040 TaxID=2692859 RepID=UPI001682027D|nr:response regulator transcription factor [Pseudanabaena sp. FACHB-2040]MBD2256866.1 response regulator transcription factor [Pseudanabaena sp. FACHB-2040]
MSQKQFVSPTILLVEPDSEVRPLLLHNLQSWGYRVVVALDEADAVQRTRDGREPFDLILLNQVGQSVDKFAGFGRYICQRAKLPSSTPVVVMAEQYGADLEGKTIQVGRHEYVTYLEDGQQLMDLLYQLCPA